MKRARRFNLILDDVSITHVAFSPEFTHAVEAKQVAQQIAQRAAFLVDQAIQEKVGYNVPMLVQYVLSPDMPLISVAIHHRPSTG